MGNKILKAFLDVTGINSRKNTERNYREANYSRKTSYNILNETNRKLDEARSVLLTSIERLDNKRQNIHDGCLKTFVSEFSKIHNFNYIDDFYTSGCINIPNIISRQEIMNYSEEIFRGNNVIELGVRTFVESTLGVHDNSFLTEGIISGASKILGMSMGYAFNLLDNYLDEQDSIVAREEEYSKLLENKQIAKQMHVLEEKCYAINKICNMNMELLAILKKRYMSPANATIRDIIEKHNGDFRKFNDYEKEQIASALAIATTLKKVTNTCIFDPETGDFNDDIIDLLDCYNPKTGIEFNNHYSANGINVQSSSNRMSHNEGYSSSNNDSNEYSILDILKQNTLRIEKDKDGIYEYRAYVDKKKIAPIIQEKYNYDISDLYIKASDYDEIEMDIVRSINMFHIKMILNSCIFNPSQIKDKVYENDIDWERYLRIIQTLYGKKFEKWQLTAKKILGKIPLNFIIEQTNLCVNKCIPWERIEKYI